MNRTQSLLVVTLLIVLPMVVAERAAREHIAFGFANVETVESNRTGSHLKGGIIVAVTDDTSKVRSFALSNEAGIAVMPLPPAHYCYAAFSQRGESLNLTRQSAERCFDLSEHQTLTIGIEFQSSSER